MDATTANYVANEARKVELQIAIAQLQGVISNATSLSQAITSTAQDAQRSLAVKTQALTALVSGAGPGVTDDFGYKADILAAFITAAQTAALITDATLIANLQALAAGTYVAPVTPAAAVPAPATTPAS